MDVWGAAFVGSDYVNGTRTSMANNTTYTMCTKSKTISRTHSTQTITCKGEVDAYAGTSKASTTVTVPALDSYKVNFNANGGSGAPSAQTKWYGETLKLSTTKPTRSNYTFLGWATSSSATSATYAAGANYTSNSGTTLYAVWKLNYIAPKVNSLSCYRVSDAQGTADDEGTYCYIRCGWAVDTTVSSGNKGQTLAIKYKLASSSSWTSAKSVTLSTASGTTETAIYNTSNALVSFDTTKSYNVQVTLTDTSGQSGNTASRTATLSQAFFTIDFKSGGHGIGLGHAADWDNNVRLGMALCIDNMDANVLDQEIPASGDPTGDTWGNGYHLKDAGNVDLGYFQGVHYANGRRGVRVCGTRTISGTTKNNNIYLLQDSSNNNIVVIDAAAWLEALGGYVAKTALPLNSAAKAYSSGTTPQYEKRAGIVCVWGAVSPKSEVAAGGSLTIGTLPNGCRPTSDVNVLCQGSGNNVWDLSISSGGVMTAGRYRTGSTNNAISTTAWLIFSATFMAQ